MTQRQKTLLLFVSLVAAATAALVGGSPDLGTTMHAGPIGAIGAGLGALGGLLKKRRPRRTSQLDDETAQFIELLRQFGLSGAGGLLGFDPATGEFGEPSGPFAGPLVAPFGPEEIAEFRPGIEGRILDPINARFDLAAERARTRAQQEATRAGTNRGSRAAVLEALGVEGVERARGETIAGALLPIEQLALQAAQFGQGARTEALQEPLLRFQTALNALNFGIGPTPFAGAPLGPGVLERILSGGFSGGLVGSGLQRLFQRGPGTFTPNVPRTRVPIRPSPIPLTRPPTSIRPR